MSAEIPDAGISFSFSFQYNKGFAIGLVEDNSWVFGLPFTDKLNKIQSFQFNNKINEANYWIKQLHQIRIV